MQNKRLKKKINLLLGEKEILVQTGEFRRPGYKEQSLQLRYFTQTLHAAKELTKHYQKFSSAPETFTEAAWSSLGFPFLGSPK